MTIFEKYASQIDPKALEESKREINDNSAHGGNYEEVPCGKYEVSVDKLECKLSKAGNPMISVWFRIIAGKYENSIIFYNGTFSEDWMRHGVVKMLASILDDDSHNAEINILLKSGDVNTINDFCLDIHEEIDGLEYLLNYSERTSKNGKAYKTYTIEEVFDA